MRDTHPCKYALLLAAGPALLASFALAGGCTTVAIPATNPPALADAAPVADAAEPEVPIVTDDATAPSDAATDGGATPDAEPTEDLIGGISAVSDGTATVDGGARGLYRAGAYFVRKARVKSTTIVKTVGPCVVETLDAADPSAPETIVSAGTIHLTGGSVPLDLVPSAKGSYAGSKSTTSTLWDGGETIAISAPGDGVPAFTASLVAPSRLTLLTPALPASSATSLTVARNAPLAFSWSGASSGQVVVYLDVATSTKAFTMTCSFKPSDGTGEVPAAALSLFPAGDGSFDVYVKEKADVVAPGWKIGFVASSTLVVSGGSATFGQAKFQ